MNLEGDVRKALEPFRHSLEIGTSHEVSQCRSPDRVFHYTSAKGLRGIVKTGNLWLFNAKSLNDPREIEYGMSLAQKALVDLVSRINSIEKHYTSVIPEVSNLLGDPSIARRHYVFSFSTEGDLLSQWRGYCPSGGFALEFDTHHLKECIEASGLEYRAVVYDPAEQRKCMKTIVDKFELLLNENDSASVPPSPRLLASSLRREALFMKQPGFREESEWRCVYDGEPGTKPLYPPLQIHFLEETLRPYVELPVVKDGKVVLTGVVVSPFGNPSLSRLSAELFLEAKGYPVNSVSPSDIVVR